MRVQGKIRLEKNGKLVQKEASGALTLSSQKKGANGRPAYILSVLKLTTGAKQRWDYPLEAKMPVQLFAARKDLMTIVLPREGVTICINGVTMSLHLFKLRQSIEKILKGQPIDDNLLEDYDPTAKALAEVRAIQKHMTIKQKSDYPRTEFPESLERLTISDVALRKVDAKWFRLSQLRELDLSNNNLGQAPNLHLLSNLRRLENLQLLDLSSNGLTELPDGLWDAIGHVRNLSLARNDFTVLPKGLYQLHNLAYLAIDHNPITELPSQIVLLESLTTLRANDCQLLRLPYALESRRPRFLRLYISGNPLLPPRDGPDEEGGDMPSLFEYALVALNRMNFDFTDFPQHIIEQQENLKICSICHRVVPSCAIYLKKQRSVVARNLAGDTDVSGSLTLDLDICGICKTQQF
ncbi:unnamed protein product, partial [Mesorhabditis spiculigera]